ncbi:biotin transporter BioY [Labrys monachus]|uniref:Biotin transporter n=1 Tax=Labrys monachus TaxID=217067 RepID=A0ABU0FJC2_9HYPH|nr:biotin transporter BioY [Labrys monachus]MDQ0394626.1 biotin transport system substrate-specific component [Labrys monachus]
MSVAQPTTSTLAAALWPAKANPALRAILLVLAGVALLTISAKVQVPFWPVPVTLQTLAVPLIGAAFGARLGGATVLAYLAAGFAGAPVFAGAAAGPAYFLGTTGGYLIAYPIAAFIVGAVAERTGNRVLPLFAAMVAADILVLALGFAWLAFLAQLASGGMGVGIERAWLGGVAPFLLADLVKMALGAALVGASWAGLTKLRG